MRPRGNAKIALYAFSSFEEEKNMNPRDENVILFWRVVRRASLIANHGPLRVRQVEFAKRCNSSEVRAENRIVVSTCKPKRNRTCALTVRYRATEQTVGPIETPEADTTPGPRATDLLVNRTARFSYILARNNRGCCAIRPSECLRGRVLDGPIVRA